MPTAILNLISPIIGISGSTIGIGIGAAVAVCLLTWGALWLIGRMHLTEKSVQETVHKIEEGAWKKWVYLALFIVPTMGVLVLWFYGNGGFKGLWHPRAFEQAEIAREIARGNGFTTKIIRPAAVAQSVENTGAFSVEKIPDTYHAPLWPTILAPFVWLGRDTWVMSPKDLSYLSDKIIAGVASFFFLLAVVVNYFIARRLFDNRLALLTVGLLLLCDRFWQFSMSGLPQMLLLFLFSCAIYTLLRAVEAHCFWNPVEQDHHHDSDGGSTNATFAESHAEGHNAEAAHHAPGLLDRPEPWLGATSILFGLMALTHGLTIWIFLAALVFSIIYFRPPLRVITIMLGGFIVLYTPWLVRNYMVSGGIKGIGGVAWYSVVSGIQGSENALLRSMEPIAGGFGISALPRKAISEANLQLESIYKFLGSVVVAPFFFISLLHLFKRREIAVFRWLVLLLWLGALAGMSLFGMNDRDLALQANDLHILFVPMMTMYGLAFVLNLWSRLEINNIALVRQGFIALLFLVSVRPFASNLVQLFGRQWPVQWPPYVPPYIAILGTWTTEKEILMSDMPWAVAWYADRKCLWLPTTVNSFRELYDYRFKSQIVGLYLTPVSGDQPFLSEIIKGDYKEWSQFIMHNPAPKGFPLHAVTAMPVDNMCIVYFDRDRWTNKED